MTPSPNAVHVVGGGVRVKSYTPLIVPGHKSQNYEQRMRTTSSSSSSGSVDKSQGQEFYAGAKFDFSPSVASLPSPPTTWTIPLLRSQSQPSSPVTTTNNNCNSNNNHHGTQIDVNSLFVTPHSKVVKASSFEMVKRSTNEKNEKERRLETQKMKKTVDKISQSRSRNEDLFVSKKKSEKEEKDKEEVKSAIATPTNNYDNNNKKVNKSNYNTPKSQLKMESSPIKHHHHSRSVVQVIESKQKQMYPQLSEHLKGLLKVQG